MDHTVTWYLQTGIEQGQDQYRKGIGQNQYIYLVSSSQVGPRRLDEYSQATIAAMATLS